MDLSKNFVVYMHKLKQTMIMHRHFHLITYFYVIHEEYLMRLSALFTISITRKIKAYCFGSILVHKKIFNILLLISKDFDYNLFVIKLKTAPQYFGTSNLIESEY